MIEHLPILVVDDDDQMLRTIGDILRHRGYAPVQASSGLSGLDVARSLVDPPAIALVDLRLPDMDGIELVARLHALSDLTEVVILTGHATVDSAVRALQEHSYDYLIKPVAPDRLMNSVDRAGERWQRRRAEAALKDSEARLRLIFDSVSDAVFLGDPVGRIIDANPAACELSGRSSLSLATAHLEDVLSSIDGEVSLGTERVIRDGQGRRRIVDVRSATFAPGLFVHTVRDLTEQRRLETELRHSHKMEAVGRLAGGVAHDFNNILTAIGCYTDFLLAATDDADVRRGDIEEIRNASQRAAALTGQLLAFSRKQLMRAQAVDLNGVAADIFNLLSRLIGEDITFTSTPTKGLWLVNADPGQMGQVIMNLAVNARDAMPAGGNLEIATRNESLVEPRPHVHGVIAPGDYVVLTVTDTGTGMSENVLAHIFEPFFTTKGPSRGTGLGLSTVYGIVAQTSGTIVVDSEPGVGTTFSVYLPRFTGSIDAAPATVDERPKATMPMQARILLVEDDVALRNLLVRLLRSQQIDVTVAASGEEAVQAAEASAHPFDLLVTDAVMPGMSGREVAEFMRTRQPDIPVLLMSGYTDDVVSERGLMGANDNLLQKPFATGELLERVRELASRPRD